MTAGCSDQALLGAIAAGDRGALRLLYERPAPWDAAPGARCADADLVDDLQDTFDGG